MMKRLIIIGLVILSITCVFLNASKTNTPISLFSIEALTLEERDINNLYIPNSTRQKYTINVSLSFIEGYQYVSFYYQGQEHIGEYLAKRWQEIWCCTPGGTDDCKPTGSNNDLLPCIHNKLGVHFWDKTH